MEEEFKEEIGFLLHEDGVDYTISMDYCIDDWTVKSINEGIKSKQIYQPIRQVYDSEGKPIGLDELTWKEFFEAFSALKKRASETNKVRIDLLQKFARISINRNRYMLVNSSEVTVPQKKDSYSYYEIKAMIESGVSIIDKNKGLISLEELFDFKDPIWKHICVNDASTLVDLDEYEIRANVKEGRYGFCRKIGDDWLISIEKFVKYHGLAYG